MAHLDPAYLGQPPLEDHCGGFSLELFLPGGDLTLESMTQGFTSIPFPTFPEGLESLLVWDGSLWPLMATLESPGGQAGGVI